MKKWMLALIVVVLTGAINAIADHVTNVVDQQTLNLRVHLSDGSHLTDADLAGTGLLMFLQLAIVNTVSLTTNNTAIVAKSVRINNAGVLTNAVVLGEAAAAALKTEGKSGHQTFVVALADAGGDPQLAGAVLIASGTLDIHSRTKKHVTVTTTNIVAQLSGVWKDGSTWIRDGTVKSAK